MNKVKFSVFSDLHCSPAFSPDYKERLDFILERAKKENVDFIIHCGDFCQSPYTVPDVIEKYNNFEIPTYHCLGNHDMDAVELEEIIKHYNMPAEYYYFDKNGFRFVALNSNYYRLEDGTDVAYSKGNYYKFPQYRDYISKEQLVWFEDVVMTSPYPVIVFSHNNLALDDDMGGDALKNREDFQNILRKAHKNKKRVLMCLNGHFHVDYMRIYEHVCYFDVNSAMMYQGPAHKLYPKEYHEAHPGADNALVYNDPIHAIVTIWEDGTIEINGMKSSFFCGVGPEIVREGRTCHNAVRITAEVLSEKIKLPIEL